MWHCGSLQVEPCEATVMEKVIVHALGILSYQNGLLYASCPVTFLHYYLSAVPIHHMVLLNYMICDGRLLCFYFQGLPVLFPLVKGLPSPILATSSLCSLLSSLFVSAHMSHCNSCSLWCAHHPSGLPCPCVRLRASSRSCVVS